MREEGNFMCQDYATWTPYQDIFTNLEDTEEENQLVLSDISNKCNVIIEDIWHQMELRRKKISHARRMFVNKRYRKPKFCSRSSDK